MKLIDKDVIIAKIDDWRDKLEKSIITVPLTGRQKADITFEHEILGNIRDLFDTLEVKEVDLKKEYKDYINCYNSRTMFETAKHFFELGLKVQKGE